MQYKALFDFLTNLITECYTSISQGMSIQQYIILNYWLDYD